MTWDPATDPGQALAQLRRADTFRLTAIEERAREALQLLDGRRLGSPLVTLLQEIARLAANRGLPPGVVLDLDHNDPAEGGEE